MADRSYRRYLAQLDREAEERGEHIAAAWRRIGSLVDPLELRFAALERRQQEQQRDAELRELKKKQGT